MVSAAKRGAARKGCTATQQGKKQRHCRSRGKKTPMTRPSTMETTLTSTETSNEPWLAHRVRSGAIIFDTHDAQHTVKHSAPTRWTSCTMLAGTITFLIPAR